MQQLDTDLTRRSINEAFYVHSHIPFGRNEKYSSKLILERKAEIGLMQPMMKIMLNVSQHGSENKTSGFVTGLLRVKI